MFHPILIENYRKLKKFPCSFTELQTTHRHPPLVWLISGHQQVMDLLVVRFKVAHLYMTFDLKYNNPKGSLDVTTRNKKIIHVHSQIFYSVECFLDLKKKQPTALKDFLTIN